MASLSIKNVPDHIVSRLRDRAARRRRSMQGELLDILETAVRAEGLSPLEEVFAEVRKLGLNSPSESAEIIRSDRDGR